MHNNKNNKYKKELYIYQDAQWISSYGIIWTVHNVFFSIFFLYIIWFLLDQIIGYFVGGEYDSKIGIKVKSTKGMNDFNKVWIKCLW